MRSSERASCSMRPTRRIKDGKPLHPDLFPLMAELRERMGRAEEARGVRAGWRRSRCRGRVAVSTNRVSVDVATHIAFPPGSTRRYDSRCVPSLVRLASRFGAVIARLGMADVAATLHSFPSNPVERTTMAHEPSHSTDRRTFLQAGAVATASAVGLGSAAEEPCEASPTSPRSR